MNCSRHPNAVASLSCSKCMNRICSRCVGDDSLGIKCIECTVISINPLYKVTKISLLLGTLTCLGCVPVVILMWAWILNYFNILFVNALIPVIIGWLVAAMISKIIKGKRSKYMFVFGSFTIVGGYVGVLLLAWSLMNVWDFVGIGTAIYIMRLKLL